MGHHGGVVDQQADLGVERERNRLFTFGAIDVGIGRGVNDRAPGPHLDHSCDCKRVFQIERSSTGSDHLNIRGIRQCAKLLADLAGSTDQEQPHPSRALP